MYSSNIEETVVWWGHDDDVAPVFDWNSYSIPFITGHYYVLVKL